MPAKPKYDGPLLEREWTLPAAATLGSAVRSKGILLEIRARLPWAARKALDVRGSVLLLKVPEIDPEQFTATATVVDAVLDGIEALPVIPREIEDILSISTSERHRWLKDGRLPSAGTRTVKLRGRARQITFHVFDPRAVEDILDRDRVTDWREADIITAAKNRRRAAANRRLQRLVAKEPAPSATNGSTRPNLVGWEEFERSGLLR